MTINSNSDPFLKSWYSYRLHRNKILKIAGFVFALLVLGFSPWSSDLWLFIPFAVASLLLISRAGGLCLALVAFAFTAWKLGQASAPAFDFLGLALYHLGGFGIYLTRSNSERLLGWVTGFFLFTALLTYGAFFTNLSAPWAWLRQQLDSVFFRGLVGAENWPAELEAIHEGILVPFFQASIPAWFCVSLAVSLLLNVLLFRLFRQFQQPGGFNRHFWRKFSEWRRAEWSLLPLVAGVGVLILQSGELFPQGFFWGSWVGWNLSVFATFPLIMSGLCLFAFVMQKLPFLVSIILVLLLVLFRLPVLVLVGIADLGFDLRSRIRSLEEKRKSEDSDES